MIVIRLAGGLGNQMFQYALYLKLRSLGKDCAFDDQRGYENQAATGVLRPVQLGLFGIDYPTADRKEIDRLRDSDPSVLSKVRRKLTGRYSLEKEDEDFIFDPSFLEKDEGYYSGFFQSAKYFSGLEDDVRKAFTFPDDLSGLTDGLRAAAEQMRGEDSVAVHMRFGDYLTKAETYGGIATPAYYASAIRLLRGEKTKFYIFSNDEEKAAALLASAGLQGSTDDITLIGGRDEEHGYLDLYLMSACRSHIIANSSFSWWGAFLGKNPGQRVAAPSVWVHDPAGKDLRGRDIYTEDMILINPEGKIVAGAAARDGETSRNSGFSGMPEDLSGKTEGASGTCPLVSVIMAAYNIETYLPAAAGSVLDQTLKDIELILVDDGSTDGSGKIADELAASDPRVKVIHKENGGLADARNAGLAIASGEYIGFVDGDDRAEPLMFESMVKTALLTASDAVTCGYREISDGYPGETGRSGETFRTGDETVSGSASDRDAGEIWRGALTMTGEQALRRYLDPEEPVIYNSVWSKLFSRKILEGLTFEKGKNSEDIVFTAKVLCRAQRVSVLREKLYDYVTDRSGSIMNVRLGERRLSDEIPNFRTQIGIFRENASGEIALRASYLFYRRLLNYYEDSAPELAGNAESAPYAEAFARILREKERVEVEKAYAQSFVRAEDARRMRCFLGSPEDYVQLRKREEKLEYPLKRALRGTMDAVSVLRSWAGGKDAPGAAGSAADRLAERIGGAERKLAEPAAGASDRVNRALSPVRSRLRIPGLVCFWTAFFIELAVMILDISPFPMGFEGKIFRITFLLFAVKLLLTEYSGREKLRILICCLLGLVSWKVSGRNDILRFAVFAASLKGIRLRQVMKVSFFVTAAGCLVLMFLAAAGISGQLFEIGDYGHGAELRWSFGLGHPNALHCLAFMLMTEGMYLFGKRMRKRDYLLLTAAQVLLYAGTRSNTGFIASLLAIAASLYAAYGRAGEKEKVLERVSVLGLAAGAVFSFAAAVWGTGPRLMALADRFLTGRIASLSDSRYHEGMISTWYAFGSRLNEKYFDLGYVRAVYWYGVIPALLLLLLAVLVIRKLYREEDGAALALLLPLIVYTVFEAHLVSVFIGRNFVLLLLGTLMFGGIYERKE